MPPPSGSDRLQKLQMENLVPQTGMNFLGYAGQIIASLPRPEEKVPSRFISDCF
jgi:hypothetical protein